MTVQLTIIGMGQIGTSIGLALSGKAELLTRLGHDRDMRIARQAQKLGALDRVEINLPNAVRKADIIILAIPFDQLRETMAIIAQDLKENAVIMDTGPVKEAVAEWAREILPPGCSYIGLTPVINPVYLLAPDSGVEAAQADLFHGGLMAIVSPPRSNSEAIKLAADLTRLLGAEPLFTDPLEIDGLMAATHILPQLLGAALLNATIDQPGWREGRKIAGRAYAEGTAPVTQMDDEQALKAAVLFNHQNVLRVLDSTIAALQAMRSDIESQDETALLERLSRARRGREKWWQERLDHQWSEISPDGMQATEKQSFLDRWLSFGRKTSI